MKKPFYKTVARKGAIQTYGSLFADGHLVLHYEQEVRRGNAVVQIEFCEIWERPFSAGLRFEGRISLGRWHVPPFLAFAGLANQIRTTVPRLDAGSEKSRQLGLAYGAIVSPVESKPASWGRIKTSHSEWPVHISFRSWCKTFRSAREVEPAGGELRALARASGGGRFV
jgi:hypothetical protein